MKKDQATAAALESSTEAAETLALRAELLSLRERIAAAARLEPQPHELHCRDCFHRGRNATLRLIAGD